MKSQNIKPSIKKMLVCAAFATIIIPTSKVFASNNNMVINATPSPNVNYILTTSLRAPTTEFENILNTPHLQTINYFDGLGRPVQTVIPKGSPNQMDLVSFNTYDQVGRVDTTFLTYAINATTSGAYNSVPFAKWFANIFYGSQLAGRVSDTRPFTVTEYEKSPLNRVIAEVGPGGNWANNPVKLGYKTNTTAISHWRAVGTTPTYEVVQYRVGSLYVNESED